MEKPLELFLEHREKDMPFCLSWATENRTALWDGGNKEVMLELKFRAEDDRKFMEDILSYMKDSRYIKIDGKPILIIYRVNIFEKKRAKLLLENFRRIAGAEGFPDFYIMLTNAFNFNDDIVEWGADALVEFPPHELWDTLDVYEPEGYVNPYFRGKILDVASFVENKRYMIEHGGQPYFRAALTNWDNTARKAVSGGHIFHSLTPKTFRKWLADIVDESKMIHLQSEDIVFINSWNEWGEGLHLEPDMKYGYAYLQAIKEVLERE